MVGPAPDISKKNIAIYMQIVVQAYMSTVGNKREGAGRKGEING